MSDNISKKHYHLASMALEEAKSSNMLFKMACLIIRGNKVLAKGVNHYRTESQRTRFPSFHAEHSATHNLHKRMKSETRHQWMKSYASKVPRAALERLSHPI